ncbi:MAG: hypothetical protein ACTHKV_08505 [Flavipsychrobacter sp.]
MLFEIPKENDLVETDSDVLSKTLSQRLAASNKIYDVLAMVEPGSCVHWVSAGEWSVHDLLLGLLQISGPASVFLSSYAFSEHPARLIADLKGRKLITSLHCLIDSRIDKRSASALTLVQNCADQCKLINTHAKVTVIENKEHIYCIVGSANYTTNKRFEAGMIIGDTAVANFYKKWIVDELSRTK